MLTRCGHTFTFTLDLAQPGDRCAETTQPPQRNGDVWGGGDGETYTWQRQWECSARELDGRLLLYPLRQASKHNCCLLLYVVAIVNNAAWRSRGLRNHG